MLKHYHDKGLLGWLASGMAPSPPPPPPPIILHTQIGPEQWDIVSSMPELMGLWSPA